MDWDRVKANWQVHSDSARQHWDLLSDEDLVIIGGDRDRLAVFVQDLYGLAREQVAVDVETWREGLIDSATLVTANSDTETNAVAEE